MAKTKADPLATYRKKRDFSKTAEPAGSSKASGGNAFIVQKHDATRLHYDLRLELDGTLKSWAVTRGPSPDPEDKRLAVRTEDHPLDYATFEGTIPEDEYGGGTVMLWDRGRWTPDPRKDPRKTIEEGHLHFTLDGERMKGEWVMFRLKPRAKEKAENWILRKVEDKYAGSPTALTEKYLTSIKTGRTMNEIAAGKKTKKLKPPPPSSRRKPGSHEKKTRRSTRDAGSHPGGLKLPSFRSPQLATLVDAVPTGTGWLHEMKYDGYRCMLAIGGGEAKIYTRTGLDWSDKFPEILEAARCIDCASALLDGEIVSLDEKGVTRFSALQKAISEGGRGLTCFLFDALEINGEELALQPNIERKARLAALLGAGQPPIFYAEHIIGAGEALLRTMCDIGQEGIISKKASAPYRDTRTKAWLKIKCTRRQEFVIVGWSQSDKKGRPFSSLLLALHEGSKLRYAGKVGTGFNQRTLADLSAKLARLERKAPSVEVPRAEARGAHWVRPKLVAEVAFAEFTAEGVVRHASYIGLRSDKPAKAIVEERPQPVATVAAAPSIRISNRDRVIYPESGITKGALADYYAALGPLMLPWLADRPVSLVRCPQGRARKCFFQKHDSGSFGPHVLHVPIREKDGTSADYLYVDDVEGILACVQMGTIEFHGWGSSVAAIEKPDRLIFDLDPDEGLGFDVVKRAARDLKRHLADMGLQTFPMLTGGKGVHVVVPLTPGAEWPEVKDFAQRFASALAAAEPDRFTAQLAKARRKGRIFIDYLRNQRGATAIMPYSARARERAPVAAPIDWNELETSESGARFTVADADLLIQRASSRALQGWGEAAQTLPDV